MTQDELNAYILARVTAQDLLLSALVGIVHGAGIGSIGRIAALMRRPGLPPNVAAILRERASAFEKGIADAEAIAAAGGPQLRVVSDNTELDTES